VSVAGRLVRHEPRWRDGVRLAVTTLRLWTRWRLARAETPVAVDITAPNGHKVSVKAWTYIDMLVIREIFLDRDYRVPPQYHAHSVLDLGSHSGISVNYFRAIFPDAVIVGVEPEPSMYSRLQANTEQLDRIVTVEAAVSDRSGEMAFYRTHGTWSSSLAPKPAATKLQVRCETPSEILARAGFKTVDLVKVDVEGAEWDLLASGQLQSITRCIVGELHHDRPNRTIDRARELLSGWSLTVHDAGADVSTFTAVR
jgi:FkbM family methyltransferase